MNSQMKQSRSTRKRDRHDRRLRLETLEDRRLLAVVTVNTDQDVIDLNDGMTSLREAIFAANTVPGADEIVFDFGHDGPATILLQHGELEITEALSIAGDGPELLTIDAQQESRIFNISATTGDGDITLAGMTLTGGVTTGDGNLFNGGAIGSWTNGMLTIENSVVSGNRVTGDDAAGGGIFAQGNVTIISCTISDNDDGGGVSAEGDVIVTFSIISDNSHGGIGAGDGNVTSIGSTITNNMTGISAANITVTSSTISDNVGRGVLGETVNISYSTMSGNGSHAISAGDGDVTVTSSTISSNGGAGVSGHFTPHNVTVANSTISGNSVNGIRGLNVNVSYSTVVGNGADGLDGGIDAHTMTIKNSVVAGNMALGEAAADLLCQGNVAVEHSLIGHNNGCSLPEAPLGSPDANGNLIGGPVHGVIDPMIAPLADNGPTFTHALLAGSPAVDAGDPLAIAGAGNTPLYDQRGAPYTRVSGALLDMGAHERQRLTVEIQDVASPTVIPVDEITIGFSYPVTGFALDDLRLSLNGGDNLLTASQTLSTSNDQTFVLGGLAGMTTSSGYYTLEMIVGGSDITDGGGGPLDSGDSVSWAMGRSVLGLTVDTLVDEYDGYIDDGDISLRDAIAAAAPGETIGFDPSLNGGTLVLSDGQLSTTRTLTIDATSLPHGLVIDAAGNSRIFHVDDGNAFSSSPATLRGLTLVGGVADRGGAILAREPLYISDCTISNNESSEAGGGIRGGTVTIRDSRIIGNVAGTGGGVLGHNVSVISSTIVNNLAFGATFIAGNTASKGCGVYGRNVSFRGGEGGGIFGDYVTVTSSTIAYNRAEDWFGNPRGGGILGGHVTVTSSTIGHNEVVGGVLIGVAYGGHIYGGTVTISSSTISDNEEATFGAYTGIHAGNLTLRNSIVAVDLDLGVVPPTVSHSLIDDGSGTGLPEAPVGSPDANGNLIGGPIHGVIDPMLGPLVDNGGPTETHALLPGSPAVDAVDPSTSPPPLLFDQRGAPFSRVFAGRVDMGAVEFIDGDFNTDGEYTLADIDSLVATIVAHTHLATYDLNSDGFVNLDDRDTWLAVAGVANLNTHDPYLLGDANLDGFVDGEDFTIWSGNKFTSTGLWSQADWNADGTTDGQDFIIWNGNKFQSSGVPVLSALHQPHHSAALARLLDTVFASNSSDSVRAIARECCLRQSTFIQPTVSSGG